MKTNWIYGAICGAAGECEKLTFMWILMDSGRFTEHPIGLTCLNPASGHRATVCGTVNTLTSMKLVMRMPSAVQQTKAKTRLDTATLQEESQILLQYVTLIQSIGVLKV